jgi:hypothetical protein
MLVVDAKKQVKRSFSSNIRDVHKSVVEQLHVKEAERAPQRAAEDGDDWQAEGGGVLGPADGWILRCVSQRRGPFAIMKDDIFYLWTLIFK